MRLEGSVDLEASLLGGQAFRWRREDDAYAGAIGRRVVRLRSGEDAIDVRGATRAAIARYLRLEPADAARRSRLARDPALAPAIDAHGGLRLLRQDPWEATVAFVTSANNHVRRIEGIVRAIAESYGEEIEEGHHAFPDAARLARATEPALRKLGLGYRAPFLRETAKLVARGEVDLASLRGASREEAREALLTLPGVGPKVADCIALMSLDVDDAFPIDRWVLRAVADVFFDGKPQKPRDVETFAHARWGRDAGLAQQYLFHAAREGAKGASGAKGA